MKKFYGNMIALAICGTMLTAGAGTVFAADVVDTTDADTITAYLEFSSQYVDVIDGTLTWNPADHTWTAQYPSDYGTTIVSGTYEDDGTMTGIEDNMGGYAIEDVPLIQESFVENLAGRFYAPLSFSSEYVDVTGGTIYWDESTMEWNAEYPSDYGTAEISGTFDEDGTLTGLEDNMDGYGIGDVPYIQEVFDNAREGIFLSAAVDAAEGNALSDEVEAFDTDNKWKSVIVDLAKEYNPEDGGSDIIFYGASNFAYWETMAEDLAPYAVQNHAFGGSTDKDLELFAPYMLYAYNPQYVFFQTGSNDYIESDAETDEEKVAEAMEFKKQMFAEFHEAMPDATFIVMSGILLPGRTEYIDMTLDINDQLKEFCDETDYMIYVDAEALTYDRETGSLVDDVESLFNDDQIHLTDAARITWAENWILPLMEELDMPTVAEE